MPHFRVTLAYDGTDFEGFQAQARGRTVQGALETALSQLVDGDAVRVAGAGRTDAGAHALGQVVCFRLERDLRPAEMVRALNGLLPRDVRACEAALVGPEFHARRSALSKLYRYELDTGAVQLPTRRRYAGHAPCALEVAGVEAAAALYRGRHDFASLASAGGSVKTTVRTVTRSEARYDRETLVYEVEADGFLRKMVRSMVGGLVAVGSGLVSVEGLHEALRARDRRAWPAPAAARGLTLVRIDYGGPGIAPGDPESPPVLG